MGLEACLIISARPSWAWLCKDELNSNKTILAKEEEVQVGKPRECLRSLLKSRLSVKSGWTSGPVFNTLTQSRSELIIKAINRSQRNGVSLKSGMITFNGLRWLEDDDSCGACDIWKLRAVLTNRMDLVDWNIDWIGRLFISIIQRGLFIILAYTKRASALRRHASDHLVPACPSINVWWYAHQTSQREYKW